MLVTLGAHVHERDHLERIEVVVRLVGVLEREGVDVDQHRHLARLADHRDVVVDLVPLDRHQEDFHVLPARLALGETT